MKYRGLIAAILAICVGLLTACSDEVVSKEQLTYDEIVNTGLANKCPQISEFTRGSIAIDSDQEYIVTDMCIEPQEYFVKVEPTNKRREAEFIGAKVLTRDTSSLDQISGTLKADENGILTFQETDGIDFQPITVQLPGGAQTPFLFTVKGLTAQTEPGFTKINTSTDFVGEFRVPSYRGSVFLDPKGRGVASGYDSAQALPSKADEEDLTRANVKQLVSGNGTMNLQIAKVDRETGEIAGTFQSEQPSSTDLGAEEPEDVRVRGIFYARIEPKA